MFSSCIVVKENFVLLLSRFLLTDVMFFSYRSCFKHFFFICSYRAFKPLSKSNSSYQNQFFSEMSFSIFFFFFCISKHFSSQLAKLIFFHFHFHLHVCFMAAWHKLNNNNNIIQLNYAVIAHCFICVVLMFLCLWEWTQITHELKMVLSF